MPGSLHSRHTMTVLPLVFIVVAGFAVNVNCFPPNFIDHHEEMHNGAIDPRHSKDWFYHGHHPWDHDHQKPMFFRPPSANLICREVRPEDFWNFPKSEEDYRPDEPNPYDNPRPHRLMELPGSERNSRSEKKNGGFTTEDYLSISGSKSQTVRPDDYSRPETPSGFGSSNGSGSQDENFGESASFQPEQNPNTTTDIQAEPTATTTRRPKRRGHGPARRPVSTS